MGFRDWLAKAAARKKPVDPALIAAVVQGVRDTIRDAGADQWMSPGQPVPPQAPATVGGRQWDFPVGSNLQYTPRGNEGITFEQLRALADGYDLIRLAIETRKDQLVKFSWQIRPIDPEKATDARCQEVQDFLRFPDKMHNWQTWLRALVEDMLVIDAGTIYPRRTRGGDIYALELIDGATIHPVIDEGGRRPLPPDPAYQQVLKGIPAVNYSADELIYVPRNVRTNRLYGYSPVEQVAMTVNIAIRRQLHQLQFYTEGNIPEAFAGLPETWSLDQVKKFQEYWDSVMEGNTAQRRHVRFVPFDTAKLRFAKEGALKDEYDEWLARVICFSFSLPPTAFVREMNRATSESAKEAAEEEGLVPLMVWVKDTIDFAIWKYWGYQDLEFQWQDQGPTDPLEVAQMNEIYVKLGVKSVDEVRDDLGLDPVGMDNAVFTGSGATLLEDIINPPEPAPAPVIPGRPPHPGEQPPHDGQQPPAGGPPHGSQPPASGEKPAAEDGAKPGDKAGKVLKRKKKALGRINRARPAIKRVAAEIEKVVAKFLRAQGPKIIAQISDALGLSKASEDDAHRIEDVLEALDFSGWVVLTGEVQGLLEDAIKEGGAAALLQIGITDTDTGYDKMLELVNERAVEYAKARAAELVGKKWVDGELVDNADAEWSITEGTRLMVRSAVVQAMQDGWSNQELAEAINAGNAFSTKRASMIARTETAMADVQGNLAGYQASGQVVGKKSVLGSEHDDDDECDENAAAGTIGIYDAFPSGDDGPPYHPNCVCDVLPVLSGEED